MAPVIELAATPMGRYGEAEPLYRRAVLIDERALGERHPGLAADLNNLASLYYEQGRFTDSEGLLERALQIREAALGADHPDVAQSLSNLALLYRVQGREADAEPLFERALQIREVSLGADHPYVARTRQQYEALHAVPGPGPEPEERTLVLPERKMDRLRIPKESRPKGWTGERLRKVPEPVEVPRKRGTVTYTRGEDGTLRRVEGEIE